MNNRIANDLIRYAELVEDGALISPEEMNCASVMRFAAEYLVQPAAVVEPHIAEQHKQSTTCGEPVAVDAQCDRFYLRGLQAGFSLGQMGDEAGFAAACRSYQKHLTEAAHGIKE